MVSGSGTIDTAGFTGSSNGITSAYINTSEGILFDGPTATTDTTFYTGGMLTGPKAFGTQSSISASSGTGSLVGVFGTYPDIAISEGYISGTLLTSSSTFTGQTFASLGFTPGTYTYTWGTGANADSLTVTSVVPEPSTWALLGLGVVGLGLGLRRRLAA